LHKLNLERVLFNANSAIFQPYHSLWFDSTRARTHDLPHLRREANHYTIDVVTKLEAES